jgi:hypothetical protein
MLQLEPKNKTVESTIGALPPSAEASILRNDPRTGIVLHDLSLNGGAITRIFLTRSRRKGRISDGL